MATPMNNVLTKKLQADYQNNDTLIVECQGIAAEIESSSIKLCTLVEELGPFLIDKDVIRREKGVLILSSVLAQISSEFLHEAELHFLTNFYCDRLQDHHSIIPAIIQGILAIVQMKYLPNDSITQLLRAMFNNIHCQSQLLPDRRNIYHILIYVVKTKFNELKAMGADFIYGFITFIDGERDPRNLMLLFNILPYFMKQFSLGHLEEEMFEIISCYFPVDFNPSGPENSSITRNDLAEALEPCLCAIPAFAKYCLPLIMEKLSSNLKVAKSDSLKLLSRGASIFQSEGLKDHLYELWQVIRQEIIPGGNTEIKNIALNTINIIVQVISLDDDIHRKFIEKIIIDIRSSLCDIHLSLFKPSVKLLEVIASVNKKSCCQILCTVIPLCLGQYSTKTSIEDKILLLENLNSFMKISVDFELHIKDIPELSWTDLAQLYMNELKLNNSSLKIKVLEGLSLQKLHLNHAYRSLLFNLLAEELERSGDDLKSVCYTSIVSFATIYPEEILLFINNRLSLSEDGIEPKILIRRLEATTAAAQVAALSLEVVPKIVHIVTSKCPDLSLTALICLEKLVAANINNFNIHHFLYDNCNIIDTLISFKVNEYDKRLPVMRNICMLIMRKLSAKEQQEVVNKYSAFLIDSNPETRVTLVMNLFIPLQQNIFLDTRNNLLENLYALAIYSPSLNIRHESCKLLSALINKLPDDDSLCKLLVSFKESIINNIEKVANLDVKKATVFVQMWLIKAVVIKGSSNSEDFLKFLTNTLKNIHVGQYVAQAFKILVAQHEETLTKENFCNIKIFYKQRIFQHFIKESSQFQNDSRQNYLYAFAYLLEEVPIKLLYTHLIEIVPLLIETVSINNEQLLSSTLMTLTFLLNSKNVIFRENIDRFIPKFLDLIEHKSMRVRIGALECLSNYCIYSGTILQPYKQDVLEKLAVLLDDPKRLVRKAATATRTQWFLINAPGGIKNE
ncbi:MMS19 nucleotide excision repair protein [Prorops nasuta]|uniref:MMS19 nucleotide excision repair protein n=1 Tax=Prorops nasuta TaxID=863751 RepID=UPI0034CFD133